MSAQFQSSAVLTPKIIVPNHFSSSSKSMIATATTVAPAINDIPERVPEKGKEKEEILNPVTTQSRTRQATMRLLRPVSSGKTADGVSITLVETYQVNTVANTDYTTVKILAPANTTEWASAIGLYDECIVDGFTFIWGCTPINAVPTATAAWCVVAFDPIEPAVLGSVNNGIQHRQHQLWLTGLSQTSSVSVGPGSQPLATTRHGFWSKNFVVPKGSARSANAITAFGHEWSNCSDAADTYGYLKPYLTNIGTAFYTYGGYILYHMRFRSRT